MLPTEPTLYPENLFDESPPPEGSGRSWRVLHTRPRQEKSLARDLCQKNIPFYLPVVPHRWRSRGRNLTSHVPLFPGYVFLLADPAETLATLSTRRVVRLLEVPDQQRLWKDLVQTKRLISSGAPLMPEDRLVPGTEVVIQSGPMLGLRGTIEKTASGRRFIVRVDFIHRGASILLEDFVLVKVD